MAGMEADAARVSQRLTAPVPPGATRTVERRKNHRRNATRTR